MNEDKITKILISLEEFRKETKEEFRNIRQNFEIVDDKLNELKSSSNALDNILVQYPIERIERLEKHNHLPKFVPISSEE